MRSGDLNLPVLDGLRGFAALCVLFGHGLTVFTKQRYHAGIGQTGVALFFMLSAFLLTHIYAARPVSGGELWQYAVKRAARILPLYYFIIPAFAIFYRLSGWNTLVLFTGVAAEWSLWTIPVELHFYALFPVIWYDIRRGKGWRALIIIAAAMFLACAMLAQFGIATSRLPAWAHFFLFGVAIGLVAQERPAIMAKLRGRHPAFGWGALALFLIATPGLRVATGFPTLTNNVDPLVILGTLALFTAALTGNVPSQLFESRIMRFLGKVSFGLYLSHWLVLVQLERSGSYGPGWFAVYLSVSLVLATAAFHLVEVPGSRLVKRLATTIASTPSTA